MRFGGWRQQIPILAEAAADHHHFRIGQDAQIRDSQRQPVGELIQHVTCCGITLTYPRSDLRTADLGTQSQGGHAIQRGTGRVHLPASPAPASAVATARLDDHVPGLARQPTRASQHFAAQHERTADASAERHHDAIVDTTRCSRGEFPPGGAVHLIVKKHGQAQQFAESRPDVRAVDADNVGRDRHLAVDGDQARHSDADRNRAGTGPELGHHGCKGGQQWLGAVGRRFAQCPPEPTAPIGRHAEDLRAADVEAEMHCRDHCTCRIGSARRVGFHERCDTRSGASQSPIRLAPIRASPGSRSNSTPRCRRRARPREP